MNYKYYICDVFTDQRFGGNQLAVFPDALGLSTKQMQQIAREFNFSESTFVFPAEQGNTRKVRIFTPTIEVPFAGHPNIGTAFVLASIGELSEELDENSDVGKIVFEEAAGLVPITLQVLDNYRCSCELLGPELLSLGQSFSVELIASALGLAEEDIAKQTHLPQLASVGLPFIVVELNSHQALQKIKIDIQSFEKIACLTESPFVHAYVRSNDDVDIRARMFVPLHGIPEDPATGSANCALAGLLAHFDAADSDHYNWIIAQGVEMGRPSILQARAEKQDGKVSATWIGGSSVMVSEGTFYID